MVGCASVCVCVCDALWQTHVHHHFYISSTVEHQNRIQALQSLAFDAPEQESLPKAGFLANCLPSHLHTTSITACIYHNYIILYTTTTTTTTTTQCKLLYVQVVLGKRPPAQVAEGNYHECR